MPNSSPQRKLRNLEKLKSAPFPPSAASALHVFSLLFRNGIEKGA
jgi:hypothetical protein